VVATVRAASRKPPRQAFSEQSKKRPYDFLTADEITALERAAKANRHGKRDWLALRAAYRHGLRASEVAGMEWHDIDFQRGTILVRRSKGGINTTHHLDGDVLRALRALKREQAAGSRFVFLSERGGPWAAVSFSRMVERLGDAVLPNRGVHAHMLRHSCGHHLAAKGIDTRRIQDYLGHSAITSTRIYTQLQSIHLKNIWG
jgi:type 1 fimbriae regulatory protein FimB/type 1 fimbriae regulatory protein FimE